MQLTKKETNRLKELQGAEPSSLTAEQNNELLSLLEKQTANEKVSKVSAESMKAKYLSKLKNSCISWSTYCA